MKKDGEILAGDFVSKVEGAKKSSVSAGAEVPKVEFMDRSQGLEVLDNVSGRGFWFQPGQCLVDSASRTKHSVEFKLSPIIQPGSLALYSQQGLHSEDDCCECRDDDLFGECARYCAASDEAITFGGQPGGPILMSMRKKKCSPTHYGLCCCINPLGRPEMEFFDRKGQPLGKAIAPFCCCRHRYCCTCAHGGITNIVVKDSQGAVEYHIHQPESGQCISNPVTFWLSNQTFNIYNANNDRADQEVGKIVRQKKNLSAAVERSPHALRLEFPPNIDATAKVRLLGATLFINSLIFEMEPGGAYYKKPTRSRGGVIMGAAATGVIASEMF